MHCRQVHLHCSVAIGWCSAFGNWHTGDLNGAHLITPVYEHWPPMSCSLMKWRRSESERKSHWTTASDVRGSLPMVVDGMMAVVAERGSSRCCSISRWNRERSASRCSPAPLKRGLWMRRFDVMTTRTTTTMWLTDDRVASYEGEGDGDDDDESRHSSTRRHWANKQNRRRRGPFQSLTIEVDLRLPTESIERDNMVAAR